MKLLFVLTNGLKLFNPINTPSCKNCKWFLPNDSIVSDDQKKINDYGFCKMYKYTIEHPSKNQRNKEGYEYAKHCRENESMCGAVGYLYEPAILSSTKDFSEITQLIEEYNELETRFSAEIMEKDEINETEDEMEYLMDEIRKYFLRK